jgi:crotonobetainyl-CoA:carnitine CoA-transferase CaiB-like acyl-CoA transferase
MPGALDAVEVTGADPMVPSSYPIAALSVAAVGVATMAAAEVWRARTGKQQRVTLPAANAVDACRSNLLVRVNGEFPKDVWNAFSGFYATRDGRFVQLHTNFRHHLERVLTVLGVPEDRDAVVRAISARDGQELEDAFAAAGACASLARTRDEWNAHPQAAAVQALPLLDAIDLEPDAPVRPLPPGERPLAGVRVLDLTRVIAGPVGTRTLAAHGADVLRVSSPALPEVDALLPDTSIGKRSTFLDLRENDARERLRALIADADVFVQSYRPGALDAIGFGPEDVAAILPDIVYVSLSAYSHAGPWSTRRGYDTLVQTASGIALAEADAFASERPRHMPISALDHATGYFAAAAAMLALARRPTNGGGRQVRCSLAQTREWVETLGRIDGARTLPPDDEARVRTLPMCDSPFGRIAYAPPGGELSRTPPRWDRPPATPGSDRPEWA